MVSVKCVGFITYSSYITTILNSITEDILFTRAVSDHPLCTITSDRLTDGAAKGLRTVNLFTMSLFRTVSSERVTLVTLEGKEDGIDSC